MNWLPNKTLDSQYLHCSKLNEKNNNVVLNFGFVFLKKLNCGEKLWSPCRKLGQSLHAVLLETATLVLLNENMAHGAAFKVRGPVTTSSEVVVVGRIGWSVNIPKINSPIIAMKSKFKCYVGYANLFVLSLWLIELSG